MNNFWTLILHVFRHRKLCRIFFLLYYWDSHPRPFLGLRSDNYFARWTQPRYPQRSSKIVWGRKKWLIPNLARPPAGPVVFASCTWVYVRRLITFIIYKYLTRDTKILIIILHEYKLFGRRKFEMRAFLQVRRNFNLFYTYIRIINVYSV